MQDKVSVLGELTVEEGLLLEQQSKLAALEEDLSLKVLGEVEGNKRIIQELNLKIAKLRVHYEEVMQGQVLVLGELTGAESVLLVQRSELLALEEDLSLKVVGEVEARKGVIEALNLEIAKLRVHYEEVMQGKVLVLGELTGAESVLLVQRSELLALEEDLSLKVLGEVEGNKRIIQELNLKIAKLRGQHEESMQGQLLVLDQLTVEEGLLLEQQSKLAAVEDDLHLKFVGEVEARKGVIEALNLEIAKLRVHYEEVMQGKVLVLGELTGAESVLLVQRSELLALEEDLSLKVVGEVEGNKRIIQELNLEIAKLRGQHEESMQGQLLVLDQLTVEEGLLLEQQSKLAAVEDDLHLKVVGEVEANKGLIQVLNLEIAKLRGQHEESMQGQLLVLDQLTVEEGLLLEQQSKLAAVEDDLHLKVVGEVEANKGLIQVLNLEIAKLRGQHEESMQGQLLVLDQLTVEEGLLLEQQSKLAAVEDDLHLKVVGEVEANKGLIQVLNLEIAKLRGQHEESMQGQLLVLDQLTVEEGLLLEQQSKLAAVEDDLHLKVVGEVEANEGLIQVLNLEIAKLRGQHEESMQGQLLVLDQLTVEEGLLLEQQSKLAAVEDDLHLKVVGEVEANEGLIQVLNLEIAKLRGQHEESMQGQLLVLDQLTVEEGLLLEQQSKLAAVEDDLHLKVVGEVEANEGLIQVLNLEIAKLRGQHEESMQGQLLVLDQLTVEEGLLLEQQSKLAAVEDDLHLKVVGEVEANEGLIQVLNLEIAKLRGQHEESMQGQLLVLDQLTVEEGLLLEQQSKLAAVEDDLHLKVVGEVEANEGLIQVLNLEIAKLRGQHEESMQGQLLVLDQLTVEEGLLLEQQSKLAAVEDDLHLKVVGEVEANEGLIQVLNLEIASIKRRSEVSMGDLLLYLGQLGKEENRQLGQKSKLANIVRTLRCDVLDMIEADKRFVESLKLEISQMKHQYEDSKQDLYSTLVQLGMDELVLSKEKLRLKEAAQGLRLKIEKKIDDVKYMIVTLKLEIPAIKQRSEIGRGGSLLTLRRLTEEQNALLSERSSLVEIEKKLRFKVEKEIEDRKCRIIALKMEIPKVKHGESFEEDLFSMIERLGDEERALLNEKSRMTKEKPRRQVMNETKQKGYRQDNLGLHKPRQKRTELLKASTTKKRK